VTYTVVVPTVGRPSLDHLLAGLAAALGEADLEQHPEGIVVVDDRPPGGAARPLRVPDVRGIRPQVVRSLGRGPAAARNAGWRQAASTWIAFLDDDVEVPLAWARELAADLAAADPGTGGVQGRIVVPLPADRRPTDWERGTAGLERAAWATADMAYRRDLLQALGGFDERFPRAYREDADLALRALRAGWTLRRGRRTVLHPVRPADDWASLRQQRGNADDVLMRALHGPGWRGAGQVPVGRFRWHALTVAVAGLALAAAVARRPRTAAGAGLAWAGLTADFARRRLQPGPRPGDPVYRSEFCRMTLTSAAIPFAAVRYRVGALPLLLRSVPAWPVPVRAVLFDRDGTLVHDVPYNGDPARVDPVPGAAEAVTAVRAAGLRTGVVTNQSGIARGLLDRPRVDAVNAEIDRQLGPFDVWELCPHGDDDGCDCRKPAGGMVLAGARRLGVPPFACAVVGDIGADVGAARAAGARAVLVPTPQTRPAEVLHADTVAPDLTAAVRVLLDPEAAR
jgi:histidinol-phosphate phosphatase family protein